MEAIYSNQFLWTRIMQSVKVSFSIVFGSTHDSRCSKLLFNQPVRSDSAKWWEVDFGMGALEPIVPRYY